MKKLIALFAISTLLFSCKDDEPTQTDETPTFGLVGTHQTATYSLSTNDKSTVYYPTDIATMDHKTPVIFFISGWSSTTPASQYDTMFKFIASHGYTVIYQLQGAVATSTYAINGLDTFLASADATIQNVILPNIDTSKIGVLGHSAGGGITLTILKHFSDMGYGANGRLVMMYDPWFAFNMNETDIQSLPSNTNVILEQFGNRGNNDANGTDARIPLTLYSLLSSIPSNHKDYYVYDGQNADHTYPYGNGRPYADMQGILKPLDALMYFTFDNNQSEGARVAALENGNDNPYDNGNGIQEVLAQYQYPCDGSNTLINYCAIVP